MFIIVAILEMIYLILGFIFGILEAITVFIWEFVLWIFMQIYNGIEYLYNTFGLSTLSIVGFIIFLSLYIKKKD